mmetsp:Transcript_13955/g.17623  ORF Transcript_13955/g.17623 Transcript_13955/m.17623 type:complete len:260 (+) Transcript_13955:429-1208(+)
MEQINTPQTNSIKAFSRFSDAKMPFIATKKSIDPTTPVTIWCISTPVASSTRIWSMMECACNGENNFSMAGLKNSSLKNWNSAAPIVTSTMNVVGTLLLENFFSAVSSCFVVVDVDAVVSIDVSAGDSAEINDLDLDSDFSSITADSVSGSTTSSSGTSRSLTMSGSSGKETESFLSKASLSDSSDNEVASIVVSGVLTSSCLSLESFSSLLSCFPLSPFLGEQKPPPIMVSPTCLNVRSRGAPSTGFPISISVASSSW